MIQTHLSSLQNFNWVLTAFLRDGTPIYVFKVYKAKQTLRISTINRILKKYNARLSDFAQLITYQELNNFKGIWLNSGAYLALQIMENTSVVLHVVHLDMLGVYYTLEKDKK